MKNPEILAPVSSPKMARAVLKAGAHILYGGLKGWSLRPDMFEMEKDDLLECIFLAKKYKRRFFMPFNCFYRSSEIPKVLELIDGFSSAGIDGVILSQIGLIKEVRRLFKNLKIQISVQSSASSTIDVDYYLSLGASGVVLPRNSLDMDPENIQSLAGRGLDIEVFVIGDDSTNYDGRCQLSAYLYQKQTLDPFGREVLVLGNANRCGYCYLACKRPCISDGITNKWLKREDLTAYRQIPQLIKAGVNIFKIQGREYPVPLIERFTEVFANLLKSADNSKLFDNYCLILEKLLKVKQEISKNHLWLLGKSRSPFWKKIRPVIEGPWDYFTVLKGTLFLNR